jgi:hypothetical protein
MCEVSRPTTAQGITFGGRRFHAILSGPGRSPQLFGLAHFLNGVLGCILFGLNRAAQPDFKKDHFRPFLALAVRECCFG